MFSVVVYLGWFVHHILSVSSYTRTPEKTVFVSITIMQSMMCVNNWVHYGLKVVFVCVHIISFHYHHYAELSESVEHIKCSSCIFCRVCVLDEVSSLDYFLSNVWGCVFFSLPISLLLVVGLFILHLIIIIKSEVCIFVYALYVLSFYILC